MMIIAVGQWLWYLRRLHRFNDFGDKTVARIGAQVLEVVDPPPKTKGHHVPMYPSPEGSHGWASFLVSWPTDGSLDGLGPDDFSLGFSTVGGDPQESTGGALIGRVSSFLKRIR
jgi:hypothetical protein